MADFCLQKDQNLSTVADGKNDLKSKMKEGLAALGDMESIQGKMNEGIAGYQAAATGPALVCSCTGGDPLASTETECLETGGAWVCKEVENYDLQTDLNIINSISDPTAFANHIAGIKERYSEYVPDLGEKLRSMSPALGNFFDNFQMPAPPKAGDKVISCNCVGGILATNEEECIAEGGKWVCEETIMTEEQAGAFSSLSSGLKIPGLSLPGLSAADDGTKVWDDNLGEYVDKPEVKTAGGLGGLASAIGGLFGGSGGKSSGLGGIGDIFGSKIPGGSDSILSFFQGETQKESSGEPGGLVFDDNLGEYVGTGGTTDTVAGLFGGVSDALTNLTTGGFPSFPKPGEKAVVATCVGGSNPLASTQVECEAAGGTWKTEVKPAPAIPTFLGGDGLPKFSPETMCNVIPKIQVKDTLSTDPQTGITSIIKKKDELPKEITPPKEPPKPSIPAPTTNNNTNNLYGGALTAHVANEKYIMKAVKSQLVEKHQIPNPQYYLLAFIWMFREMIYSKAGLGTVDGNPNLLSWANPINPNIDRKEAEKRYKEYAAFVRNKTGKDTPSDDIDKRIDKIWGVYIGLYTKDERSLNRGGADTYAGEQGHTAFVKALYDKEAGYMKERAAKALEEAKENPAPAATGSTVASTKPAPLPQTDFAKEMEEVPPPPGQRCIKMPSNLSAEKEYCFKTDIWEYNGSLGAFVYKPTGDFFDVGEPLDLDDIARAMKFKRNHTWQVKNRRGSWNVYRIVDGVIQDVELSPIPLYL